VTYTYVIAFVTVLLPRPQDRGQDILLAWCLGSVLVFFAAYILAREVLFGEKGACWCISGRRVASMSVIPNNLSATGQKKASKSSRQRTPSSSTSKSSKSNLGQRASSYSIRASSASKSGFASGGRLPGLAESPSSGKRSFGTSLRFSAAAAVETEHNLRSSKSRKGSNSLIGGKNARPSAKLPPVSLRPRLEVLTE